MLVHVPKDRICKGMFIELVECPHSEFGKRRFLLTQERDRQAIMASSAERVLVNTALGIDQTGRPSSIPAIAKGRLTIERVQEKVETATVELRTNLDQISDGERPDFHKLGPLVQTMADVWHATPTVALEMTRLKTKDEGTYVHSLAVATMMTQLGDICGLDHEETTLLGVAGLLHDIGKLKIPDEILNKPGRLTEEERDIIRSHPDIGYDWLRQYDEIPQLVLDVTRLHHEVLDGSGYPLRLTADELSLPVRISTVCDVFEALTSARPYKAGWPAQEALDWMFARPHLFDRKLVVRLGGLLMPHEDQALVS
ncbi:HD-GYP domain-containing protein [Peteryoungia ipomoeae]|uniref:HD-GYP domain-containing protein n=1 Tax=Peteryoungia ipomoeae TaxID=1210932 RepID=A0A4S8NUU6_9HYPH|nr:HD-GYP domain-containing protein [Peteryoungia ipomoeae]THV21347.1 HD-GYP domain-containing protein [Peteryoungia ipomoeae]